MSVRSLDSTRATSDSFFYVQIYILMKTSSTSKAGIKCSTMYINRTAKQHNFQSRVHTTEPTGPVPEPFHCDHIARWSARSGTT